MQKEEATGQVLPHQDALPLRPPQTVMRLKQMGSFFPTRLSFLRVLFRKMAASHAKVERTVWDICDEGFGRAVYSVQLPSSNGESRVYSLCAFSNRIDDEDRTDRVIAEVWDSAYVLYDGVPEKEELDRLEANAPRQEAGRFQPQDLVLSRANKSLRLFAHVVESLSNGVQPDREMVDAIGYLMRTTAVYGNGKFGIADRAAIDERHVLNGSFAAEMLTVWLIRGFTHDLVEHVAKRRNPRDYVPLDIDIKRHLGIGNSTGLGMAPFLVNHPILLNNWMIARETAISRVRVIKAMDTTTIQRIQALFERAQRHVASWTTDDQRQMARIETLRQNLDSVAAEMNAILEKPFPFAALIDIAKNFESGSDHELEELLIALSLEVNGELVDELADCMTADREPVLDPTMTTTQLAAILRDRFEWATSVDFDARDQTERFWYVSEEKLEPRLGNRYEEAGAELEMPLDIARQVQALASDLQAWERERTDAGSLAEFLMRYPCHRNVVKRVQANIVHPYSEICNNLIGANCLPIDMLRCKLSFFGASRFDPKSDRWTRITLCQGAPLFDELQHPVADDWWLPAFASVASAR